IAWRRTRSRVRRDRVPDDDEAGDQRDEAEAAADQANARQALAERLPPRPPRERGRRAGELLVGPEPAVARAQVQRRSPPVRPIQHTGPSCRERTIDQPIAPELAEEGRQQA